MAIQPTHAGGQHLVKIYDDDRDLVNAATDFLVEGLIAGEPAVVVATGHHCHELEGAAWARGIDTAVLADERRYLAVDANHMLSRFMIDGAPDTRRFHEEIGRLLSLVRGRRVRVFGEMVALLWGDGNVVGAIEVEALWNSLAAQREFSLYCAYALSSFGAVSDLRTLRDVCRHHSDLVPPRSYEPDQDRRSPPGSDVTPTQVFVPSPLAVRAARDFVRDTLDAWDEPALVERAVLVTSELATNAVVHAGSPFRVAISRIDGTVVLTVHDGGDGTVRARRAEASALGGRGLAMVDSMCPTWGSERVSDGTLVWAELAALD